MRKKIMWIEKTRMNTNNLLFYVWLLFFFFFFLSIVCYTLDKFTNTVMLIEQYQHVYTFVVVCMYVFLLNQLVFVVWRFCMMQPLRCKITTDSVLVYTEYESCLLILGRKMIFMLYCYCYIRYDYRNIYNELI